MVRKRINQPARVTRQQAAMDQQLQQSDNTYAGNAAAKAEPFALLHRST
jgi:hypothetical protein